MPEDDSNALIQACAAVIFKDLQVRAFCSGRVYPYAGYENIMLTILFLSFQEKGSQVAADKAVIEEQIYEAVKNPDSFTGIEIMVRSQRVQTLTLTQKKGDRIIQDLSTFEQLPPSKQPLWCNLVCFLRDFDIAAVLARTAKLEGGSLSVQSSRRNSSNQLQLMYNPPVEGSPVAMTIKMTGQGKDIDMLITGIKPDRKKLEVKLLDVEVPKEQGQVNNREEDILEAGTEVSCRYGRTPAFYEGTIQDRLLVEGRYVILKTFIMYYTPTCTCTKWCHLVR